MNSELTFAGNEIVREGEPLVTGAVVRTREVVALLLTAAIVSSALIDVCHNRDELISKPPLFVHSFFLSLLVYLLVYSFINCLVCSFLHLLVHISVLLQSPKDKNNIDAYPCLT